MSRFFRAQLPPPKRFLALARLACAARLFENPGVSVSSVSDQLYYSSPQSFSRHVRALLRMSAVEFRVKYDGDGMLDYFREELVLRYLDIWRTFDPFGRSARAIGLSQSRRRSRVVSFANPAVAVRTVAELERGKEREDIAGAGE